MTGQTPGQILTAAREALGLSQEQAVERLEAAGYAVTRQALSHWETGRNAIPVRALIALRVALGVDPAALLEAMPVAAPFSEPSE